MTAALAATSTAALADASHARFLPAAPTRRRGADTVVDCATAVGDCAVPAGAAAPRATTRSPRRARHAPGRRPRAAAARGPWRARAARRCRTRWAAPDAVATVAGDRRQ